MNAPDLSVRLGPLRLRNPVLTASGTCGFGREIAPFLPLSSLGALVTKGITLEPRAGNPPPRVTETPAGMLNAVGLQNPGVEAFLRDELPWLREQDVPVIVNISGRSVDEYARLAERLDGAAGVAALEINISCPNVREGGAAFGARPEPAAAVTAAVRKATTLPVIVKLSPNAADISAVAAAAAAAGADILSLINTLVGMEIDIRARRPVLANITGGLSGPAVRPVALRMVWEVRRAVRLPLIGMGGVASAEDAIAFMLAGAGAVAVGTAAMRDPGLYQAVAEGIRKYLVEGNFPSAGDIVGLANSGADSLM
ncbi:MAG: dihydroorotate dehydrogenase [Patescibacteria group bacterium]